MPEGGGRFQAVASRARRDWKRLPWGEEEVELGGVLGQTVVAHLDVAPEMFGDAEGKFHLCTDVTSTVVPHFTSKPRCQVGLARAQ